MATSKKFLGEAGVTALLKKIKTALTKAQSAEDNLINLSQVVSAERTHVSNFVNTKGKANGLATLDANSKLTPTQLPLGETSTTAYAGNKGKANADAIAALNTWQTTMNQNMTEVKGTLSKMGKASGIATLDTAGKVPSSQLPSYVDDVLEYDNKTAFPATGETGKIYISKNDNKTWRWSGTAYVEISASIALGETSSTAYAGNKGKANADAIASLNTWKTSAASDISTAKTDISSLKTKVSSLEGVTYVEITETEIDSIYNELAV